MLSIVCSKKRCSGLLLIMAMLVGALLRLIGLDTLPPGLQQDEAMNGLDAYSLGLTGRDHFGHLLPIVGLESFGDWVSPLLTFLSAPVIGLVGPRVDVLRGVAAIVGLLAIPALYWCGLVLFGRYDIAVVAAWVLALEPAHVHLSRFAIPPVTVVTFVPLCIAATVAAIRKGHPAPLMAAGAVAGLTVLGYPTMKLYVPLLLATIMAIEWRQVRAAPIRGLFAGAVVFALVAGPNLLFSIVDPTGRTRLSQVSTFGSNGGGPLDGIAGYLAYFTPEFLFATGDGDTTHGSPLFGLFLWALLPLLLQGFVWLLARVRREDIATRRRGARILLAVLFLAPLPGALTVPSPHMLRGAPLLPLGLLLCAAGLASLFDAYTLRRQRRAGEGAWIVVLIVVLLVAPLVEGGVRLREYFTSYPAVSAVGFSAGIGETVAWVMPRAVRYDEIWLPFSYNYLLFYGAISPTEVQRTLVVRRTPGRFNTIAAYGPYRFGVPPSTDLATFRPETIIYGPDHLPRYEIGSALAADGRKLLVALPVRATP